MNDMVQTESAHPRGVIVVTRFLEARDIPHRVVTRATSAGEPGSEHPPNHSTGVALRVRGGWRMAMIPAHRRLDLARARLTLGDASLRFASEPEIAAIFPDFDLTLLPPIGPHYPDPELFDRSLLEHDEVSCETGHPGHHLLVDPRAIVEIARPRVADLCEPNERD
jgi:prolyl-tRNA editing enzyme YbaK/EbsC (Cys-tRNA(Pro) deacylase)